MRYLVVFLLVIAFSFAKGENNETKVKIPKNLDPVYMLDVTKYPKFNAFIELANGKTITFCCPKAMFDFYLRPFFYKEYNIKGEKDFKAIYVTDYLSGKKVDAKKALYIFGSKLPGPKGDDLIPVKDKTTSQIFRLKYGGSKVLTFGEVVKKGMGLIKFLDMP